jgi:YfiH family protein
MWTLDHRDAVPAWRCDTPAAVLAFSTRRGGVSRAPYDTLNVGRSTEDDADAIVDNRLRLLHALGLDPEALVTAGQVHGDTVRRVDGSGHVPGCDALLTTRPGVVLAVTTADCMPILLHAGGAIAAVHAGWRGAADGLPARALANVAEAAGVSPADVDVHLGPCIRGCCYEVGDEVAARFPAAAVLAAAGRPRLDLPAALRLQLGSLGVPASRLHDVGACTACEPDVYFSHRRDAGRTGRHWAVAALRPRIDHAPSGARV